MKESDYEVLKTTLAIVDPSDDGPNLEPHEIEEAEEEVKPLMRVIETIFVMHSVKAQHELDTPEFVTAVMSGVEDSKNPAFSGSELKAASTRLKELLTVDGMVSRRSKARNVVRDHGLTYCGFRVLTDIRPVFPQDADEDPDEMVIVHTIKLAYHEGGRHKEIFVSADSADLKKLREALDRAEKKEATLARLLEGKQIKVSGMGK